MNFSTWAIRNPVPVILLFALLTVLGLLSFSRLGIQQFPDMELPMITVSATLEGAAPGQLETEVARKIEDKLATLGGIDHIATTIGDGTVQIQASFELEKDGNEAQTEVRNAVDGLRAELPPQMASPLVAKLNTAGSPLLTYSVSAEKRGDASAGQDDEEALSWLVDNDLSKALSGVKGVGQVSRIGGVTREVQVELDPALMAGLGLGVAEVSAGLKAVQIDASGGRGEIGGAQQSVRLLGAVPNAAALAQLDLPLAGGRHVRLNQVARVVDGIAERKSIARLDGKAVIGFQVLRSKGHSEVAVAASVRLALKQFAATHPQLTIHEAFNGVDTVENNYRGSMHLLYEGAALAVLVVWFFLRDWRATLVSATALPLSILPTFTAMQAFGFSLNTLTLLALALVVGILVDDAIVEIENIVRHLRMGKSPLQAAKDASQEIGLAVIATTFTLVAVFLPTAFMGGVPGKFFRQFGLTAAVAVLASLLVARLLTPMMAAYLLQHHAADDGGGAALDRTPRWLAAYMLWVERVLGQRRRTVLAALLFCAASLMLLPLLPKGFIPAADGVQSQITLEMQPGTTLAEMDRVSTLAQAAVAKVPEVQQVFAAIGVSSQSSEATPGGHSQSSDTRTATLTVNLLPNSQRQRSQQAIELDLRQRLAALPATRVKLGRGEVGETLELTLIGNDSALLASAARAVERELRQLGHVSSSASLQRPEIRLHPDYARAAELGVSTQALAGVMRLATAGDFAFDLPKLNLPQRQVPVRVRLAAQVRNDLDALGQLRVSTASGSVPLSSVASLSLGNGPAQLERYDRARMVKLSLELTGRSLGSVLQQVDALPALQHLPPGVTRLNSGEAERMNELFGSFGSAMLIGVLSIYIVLVLLFHDFMQPATILAALPLSLGGALLALLLTHSSLSMPAVIGLLMLMGVVTKNSILLVEYAVMARREHGMQRRAAIIDACKKRARPILMTTIAMGAGMLPVAMGFGADPGFRQPMAIVVIGGLLTSTVLSLLVIPVVFTYVDDGLEWVKRRVRFGEAGGQAIARQGD